VFWKLWLVVGLSLLGLVAWVWQHYLRIIVNLFLGVVVRAAPDEEQRFDGEEVSFRTVDGIELVATLAQPAGSERPPVVVFCHEFGSDRRSAGLYAGWLLGAGYAVLAFDFRGHGDSKNTGDYVPRQWATHRELTDLEAALAYVRSRDDLDSDRLGLFGIFRGGATATALASRDRAVAALVTDGTFSTRRTLLDYMHRWVSIFADVRVVYSHLPEWVFRMYQRLTLLVSELRLGVRFLDLEEALAQRRCPLLMIHGEDDSHIDVSQARWLYEQAAAPPKELWVVPGARHNQAATVAASEYRKRILHFFTRSLPVVTPTVVEAASREHGGG